MTVPPHRLREVVAVAALVVGLALITVAAVGGRPDRSAPVAFGDPSLGEAEPKPAPTPTAGTPAATSASHGSAVRPGVPVRLSIPSLDVSAAVDPVEVTNGLLAVPDDVSRVGWWSGSRPAGAGTGTTVIDGHIDSAREGLGALFSITRLRPGDTIVVTTGAASRLTYRVYAGSTYRKAGGLPADLFSDRGPGRLVLISCGGPFDQVNHSYEDNVAVFASLEP